MEAPTSSKNEHIEMASVFVKRELKHQIASLYIKCFNGETHNIPRNPISIFTQEDLDAIPTVRQRIFHSYFSSDDTVLLADLTFEPETTFDYLLIGIYHKKNGMDEQLVALLDRRPELFIFTLQNYFEALFTPYLQQRDFNTLTILPEHEGFPLCIILDDEPYDCLSLAEELHSSPWLKDITYHMSKHHHTFKEEIAKRAEAGNREEVIYMISDDEYE